ncbi:MAG: cell division protein FtsA [Thermodesulfovibrionales bacterium]
MPLGNIVVGLDVGTTKICVIVGKEENGRLKVVSIGTSSSHGIRKGIIVDRNLVVNSIRKALKAIEGRTAIPIRSAYVSIAGSHIKGFNGYGAIRIRGRTVREGDVERLIDSAGAAYVPVDREILHVIPKGFRLDGRNGISNPIGMFGERLEASVQVITASTTSIQDLVGCCEEAGVEVSGIVLEPLASAESVLKKDEKDRGAALIDIGCGTTGIAVYRDGVLRHAAVLALGGNHLTNDIAVGLGVSACGAEEIKKTHGCSLMSLVDENEEIDINDNDKNIKKVPINYLTEIIQLRCEELIGMVKEETEAYGPKSIILTGGTSLLRGIGELAEDMFGLPVRIGMPEGMMDRGLVDSPVYAAGVGLVSYGLTHSRPEDSYENRENRGYFPYFWQRREKIRNNEETKISKASPFFERMRYLVSSFLNK